MTLAAEIERNPEPIDRLTAGQAKMVHVLRAAAGRIVTAGQLGEAACRDRADPPLSNSVTSMMCQLRRRRPRPPEIAPLRPADPRHDPGDTLAPLAGR